LCPLRLLHYLSLAKPAMQTKCLDYKEVCAEEVGAHLAGCASLDMHVLHQSRHDRGLMLAATTLHIHTVMLVVELIGLG